MNTHRKHITIGLGVVLILSFPLYASVAKQLRIEQFKAVEAQMPQSGASLTWELVDGKHDCVWLRSNRVR